MASLKVLFLATRDLRNPGVAGGDINMWECARYLAFSGHMVTFLASSFPGAKKQETLDGVRVVRLGGLFSLWLATFLYYMRHGRGRYDVVVAEGFGGSRIPRFAPLYVKEPILTEWRQVHRELFAAQYPAPVAALLNVLEQVTAFVHRNTKVLAYTLEGKEAFAGLGFRRENVFVVPVSIRGEWLHDQRDGRVAAPVIIWLGKFRRYKCPHHVLLAMPRVISEFPTARLILAGRHDDARYERELRSMAARLDLTEHIEFRFDLSEEEKKTTLRACRLMVLPSSVEGFGIVVLEANACGLPVVASSGVPESVVADDRNGIRYPFGDIDALARSLLRLLHDDALRQRLSAQGLEFVRSFEWQRVGGEYEAVIKSLAKTGRSTLQSDSNTSDTRPGVPSSKTGSR